MGLLRCVPLVLFACCAKAEPRAEARGNTAPAPPASASPTTAHEASPGAVTSAPEADSRATMTKTLTLSSPAFAQGSAIPAKHTCEGANVSPPLVIGDAPAATRSLALVVEDPDAPDPAAPKTVWAHWVAYDLPASTRSLEEGAGNHGKLGRAGKNDWGSPGYRGPCPPVGKHRYFFRLFALDRELGDLHEPTKAELLKALEGHVVARGELLGTYQKGR